MDVRHCTSSRCSAPTVALELPRPERPSKHSGPHEGVKRMTARTKNLLIVLGLSSSLALAAEPGDRASARHITLQQAVQLELQHNHVVRIAEYKVKEKQHAKEVAKSTYFPTIRNDSSFVHLTDTQMVQIDAGSLGTVAGTPVPSVNSIINQGGRNLATSGTMLEQPLTQLFTRVKPA